MLFGRVLLNNEHYNLTIGLLGGGRVYFKGIDRTVRIMRDELSYLLNLSKCLQNRGIAISPDSEVFEYACEQFCEAVGSRSGAGWRAFFRYSPDEHAQEYVSALTEPSRG